MSKQNDNSVESETNQNNKKGFESSKKTGNILHFYRGKFHLLPNGWVMPSFKFQSFQYKVPVLSTLNLEICT